MRTISPLAVCASFLIALAAPLRAQVKGDLGAALTAPAGSAAAASASAGASVAPLPAGPSLSLSAVSLTGASQARLAPAAAPASLALPASALAPAAARAAAADAPRTRKDAPPQAAAPAPAAPLGPSSPGAAAEPDAPPVPFLFALGRLGVPQELAARLYDFLSRRHPGNQNAVYHGFGHTREVANLAARIASDQDLPPGRRVLLILSGALHDVDPERAPETPARVSATLAHLDADPEARELVAEFGARYGFTADQVKALIMATDFSMVPAEMEAKQAAFVKAAREAFPGEEWGVEWGRRLAFADQISSYVGSSEAARKRVEGLAHEIRTGLDGKGPTDAQMLAGTAKFLGALARNPDFAALPPELRENFRAVQAYFEARQTPEAWSAPSAPVPARAPPHSPDVEAAKRYVRSIAAGLTLSETQTDALIGQYFEEEGIAPGSERAEAVRRALVPARAAADDKAAAGLSPAMSRRRGVLLAVAADHGMTPAAVEASLKRRGVLEHLAGADDESFRAQAERALQRDELDRAVASYPENEQGAFLRSVARDISAPSGKSIEEVTRAGVFAYVDFHGKSVTRATTGRDPDVTSVQMVFYVTREDGRWKIGGYRQNRSTGRSDAELAGALRRWLTDGGIPAKDLK